MGSLSARRYGERGSANGPKTVTALLQAYSLSTSGTIRVKRKRLAEQLGVRLD